MIETLLARLAHLVTDYPRRILLALAIPTAIFAYLAATVPLDLSFAAITPQNDPRIERFFEAIDNFGSASEMLVVIEGDDPQAMRQFADELVPILNQTELIDRASAREDLAFFRKNALLYLDPEAQNALGGLLTALPADFLTQPRAKWPLEALRSQLREVDLAAVDWEDAGDDAQRAFGLYANILEAYALVLSQDMSEATIAGAFQDALAGRRPHDGHFVDPKGYYFSPDGTLLLIRMELAIDPIRLPIGVGKMAEVEDAVEAKLKSYPQLKASLGGLPAISYEDQSYVVGQVERLSPISLLLMLLLFLYVERSIRIPAFVGICMVVALVWTFGWVHIIFEHVTAMSAIFGILLFGLGVDYAVHLAARLREEEARGASLQKALSIALVKTGPSIVAGAGTTAVAFISMKAFNMKSADHLGVTTAVGILCCLIMMMTLLPALIRLLGKRGSGARSRAEKVGLMDRWVALVIKSPRSTLLVTLGITLLMGLYIPTMQFQSNLEDIITQDMKSSRAVALVRERFHLSTDFAILAVDSVDEAHALATQLEENPEIVRVEGIHQLIPQGQAARLEQARELAETVGQVMADQGEIDPPPTQVADLWEVARSHAEIAAELAGLMEMVDAPQLAEAERAAEAASKLMALLKWNSPDLTERLARLDSYFYTGPESWLRDFAQQGHLKPIGTQDLPPAMQSTFIGKNGQYQLRAYPRGSILSVEAAQKLTKILPEGATGAHELAVVMVTAGRDRLPLVATGLMLLITIALIIGFRSPWMAAYAVVPLAVGATIALGTVIALGRPVSVLMASAFPLILGIGIDDGIHVVLRWKELRAAGVEEPRATFEASVKTGRAILMTTITTLCGFGALLLINHAGIRSMASLVCVGVALCFVCSVSVLPAVILAGESLRQRFSGP